MSDFINPEAIIWREDNERLHRAGKLHRKRLFGMVACRLCQDDHEADSSDPAPDASPSAISRAEREKDVQ